MVLSSSLQSLTTRPLILQHRRSSRFFLTSHHQWRQIQNQNNGVPSLGLFHLHNRHPPSLNPPLPLRRRLLLPSSPLHPLLRPRPPPLRHLSLSSSMTTTTPAAATASHSSDSSSATKTVRVVIKGRVQGVFYRNWTIDNANELGLRGWVRNRRDGSVEALLSGNPNSVDEMQLRCRRGPPAAVVTGLEVFPSSDDPGSGFDRKPTVDKCLRGRAQRSNMAVTLMISRSKSSELIIMERLLDQTDKLNWKSQESTRRELLSFRAWDVTTSSIPFEIKILS